MLKPNPAKAVRAVVGVTSLLAFGAATVWQRSTIAPATPLGLAAHHGDVNAVRALVAAGADVDAQDEHGYTPLAWAARGGQPLRPHACRPQSARHLETIRVLLELGADPRLPSTDGWLPARVAEHHRQDQSAALLALAAER